MKKTNNLPFEIRKKGTSNEELATQLADIAINRFGVSVESFPIQVPETDDTARIQRAINSISSGFVVLANKTYNIKSLTMKSNVFLYSVNATLKLINNSSFYTRMLSFTNASNTGVYGVLNIDGNRANDVAPSNDSTIGVYVAVGCSDLFFDTIIAKNLSMDGLYIGGTATPQPQNIHVKKIITDNCGRNGISITSGQDIFLGDVITRNTNGQDPKAGVDIETNVAADTLKNINIDSLTTYGNAGAGLQILGVDTSAISQGQVTVKKLISRNNQSYGLLLYTISHVNILDGMINNNTLAGVSITRNVRHLRLRADVFANGTRGIDLVMTSQNIQSYDFDFSGCRVYNNSQTTANSLDGMRVDSDSSSYIVSRVYVDECVFYDNQATPTQRYGLSTGSNVEKVRGKCDFYGNASGDRIINATKSKVITFEQSSSLSMLTQTVNANSTLTVDLTATGVTAGGGRLNITPSIGLPLGIIYSAYVFSNNTVRVVLTNVTASNISVPALTWYTEFNY
jgi:hypothetical protein